LYRKNITYFNRPSELFTSRERRTFNGTTS
jgi:hypothetical protein